MARTQTRKETKNELWGKCPICGGKTKGGMLDEQIMFYCINKKCETLVYPGKLVQEAFKKL